MQRLNDNICPKCHQALDETLLENRAASWKLSCRRCNFQKFKCYCPKCNSSIETTNPNLIADGFRLTCPSSDCQNQFQVIKCPHPDCKKFNFFNNGSYSMGELVRCRNCQTAFQQLTCPHCLEPNYWRGDVDNFYAAGNVTQCYACQRKFQHLQCPHCKQPKYFKNCEYIGGIKQTCDGCTRNFQHSLCSTCHTPNYYPQCNFKYGTKQVCCNNQCKQEFELVICPDCAKENLFKQNLDQGAPALKEYNCWNCKSKFSHCLCKFCQDSIYPRTDSDFRNGSNTIQCPSCKKGISDFFKCDRCTKVSTDAKDCRFCPPKPTVPFREINIFSRPQNNPAPPNNNVRSSIFNVESPSFYPPSDPNASVFNRLSRVPLPSSGINQNNNNRISSIFGGGQPTFQTVPTFNQRPNTTQNASKTDNVKTITKEQKKPEPEPQNLEEGKTCVICFSQPSDMAFIPCGHKKTCTECSNRIMQSNRSCPICRKPIQSCMKIFE